MTAVVVLEFFSGLPPGHRERWSEYFARFHWWVEDFDTAAAAGARRYDLARQGRQLSLPDSLITEVARRMGATVVTENRDDFVVAGIPILSLSLAEAT